MARFPFPIPNGWFAVARSDEVATGQVVPAHYFGRELAIYRTADGEPRVVDAHCPHLGAHLAHGGQVRGELLECPFHAWRFDGVSGRCVEVPYTDADPSPKARVRSYPVVERFGLIFAWLMIHRFRVAWLSQQVDRLDLDEALAARRAEAEEGR